MGDTAAGARTELPGYRPVLSGPQIEVLHRYGAEQSVVLGDVLFRDGDETYDLIVLLEGEVQIVEHYAQADEFVIVTYRPGEFLGEIGLLTGQRAYLTAIVSAPGRVLRIRVQQVHTIMDQELELSELILRAFLVRHSRLTRLGSGLTLVGSRFDVNARRLLEVFSRNRLSSRWLDLEGDPAAEAFLRRLNVPVADLPIVVVPGGDAGGGHRARRPGGDIVADRELPGIPRGIVW
jgi:thioredoxin reductase (NADPH)